MNIAALIGISKYKNAAPLPACAADVEQMRALLTAAGKYDEILTITDQTASDQVKDSLRAFFAKYRDSGIDEAFVYFSGHGLYHNDALLCCSDFDPNRPSTTSIANSELDDLLRSIAPNVAVKIIDACQSGSPYIKDASAGFEKAFRSSQLKAFLCMASSRLDQSSYATADASAFTEKWIEAALLRDNGIVLYRDIQAALADAFVNTPEQTPFFVNQGSGLESFAAVTDEMRRLVGKRTGPAPIETKDAALALLLGEIAKHDAVYVSQEDAYKSIEAAAAQLESTPIQDQFVAQLFTKKVVRSGKLGNLPRVKQVAAFAEEQGWSKNYFVKIPYEEYKVRVRNSLSDLMKKYQDVLGDSEPTFKVETKTRPATLEATQALPFEVAEIQYAAPDHPSLRSFVAYFGLVHSLSDVMVLSAAVRLTQKGWSERAPEFSELQWKYQSYRWSEIVSNPARLVSDTLANAELVISTYLQSLIPKQDPPLREIDATPPSGEA